MSRYSSSPTQQLLRPPHENNLGTNNVFLKKDYFYLKNNSTRINIKRKSGGHFWLNTTDFNWFKLFSLNRQSLSVFFISSGEREKIINFKENTSVERKVVGICCRGILLCVSCLKRIDNLNHHEVQLYLIASKNEVSQFSYCQRNPFRLFIRREFCELLFDSDILNFVALCAEQILETSFSLYLIVKKKKSESRFVSPFPWINLNWNLLSYL